MTELIYCYIQMLRRCLWIEFWCSVSDNSCSLYADQHSLTNNGVFLESKKMLTTKKAITKMKNRHHNNSWLYENPDDFDEVKTVKYTLPYSKMTAVSLLWKSMSPILSDSISSFTLNLFIMFRRNGSLWRYINYPLHSTAYMAPCDIFYKSQLNLRRWFLN